MKPVRDAIRTFQIAGDLCCYLLDTILNDDVVVIVAVGIDAIFNDITVDITLSFARTPAIANIGDDIDDLEGREKAIL